MTARATSFQRPLTLTGLFASSAAAAGDKVAVLLNSDPIRYRELQERSEYQARRLLGLGVQSGDRVGVLLPNCLDYFEIVLGAASIGTVIVPMNIRYKSRELTHLIVDSGMVALITCGGIDGVADF